MSKILLNESDITYLVKEAVSRVLNEIGDTVRGQYRLGRLDGRYTRRMRYSKDDDESLYNLNKANEMGDYAADKLTPDNFSGSMDDLSDMLQAYRLGYYDEVNRGSYEDDDTENEREFRKKHLGGVCIK